MLIFETHSTINIDLSTDLAKRLSLMSLVAHASFP